MGEDAVGSAPVGLFGLAAGEPLITGPAPVLWIGVGSVILLLVAGLYLLMRWQVGAARRRSTPLDTDFFKPAGDEAEITFEDQEPPEDRRYEEPYQPVPEDDVDAAEVEPEPVRNKGAFAGLFGRKTGKPRLEPEPEFLEEAAAEAFPDPAPAPEPSPWPASRWQDPDHDVELTVEPAGRDDEDERRRDDSMDAVRQAEREAEAVRRRAEQDAAEIRARAEEQSARVRAAAEEAAAAARRHAEDSAARLRASGTEAADAIDAVRVQALDARLQAFAERIEHRLDEMSRLAPRHEPPASGEEIYRTLAAFEEALVAQSEGLKADTRNLFADFAREVDAKIERAVQRDEARRILEGKGETQDGDADGRIASIVEMMSRRLAEHREAVNASLAALTTRIDRLAAAPEDLALLRKDIAALRGRLGTQSGPSAPSVQLVDIVKNALPPNAYALNARLGNNRRADCLVTLPYPPGPIAIDARFPVEAWRRLHDEQVGADGVANAETEFRRTALRHIVDIAERLIVPDETAESALMFVPSESLFAELHVRFPDLVQDSYRARVWIVSPTSLMATLHTIRAVLRDAQARESVSFIHTEAQSVMTEVDRLRQRVGALEESFDRARADVRDLMASTDQVYRRAETITDAGRALAEESLDRGARRLIRLETDDADDHVAHEEAAPSRDEPPPAPRPFPLR